MDALTSEHWALFTHTIISFLGNNFLAHQILKVKRSWRFVVGVWSLALAVNVVAYIIIESQTGVTVGLPYYLISALYLLVYGLVFEAKFSQQAFVFFMLWSFSSFLSAFCKWAVLGVAPGPHHPWVWVGTYFIAFALIGATYRFTLQRTIREALEVLALGPPIYGAFPLVAFVVFAALYGPLAGASNAFGFVLMVLYTVLIVFMYYLLFTHSRLVQDRVRAEGLVNGAQRQFRLQKQYFEELEKEVAAQARFQHDARHHLHALSALARSGGAGEVERYVSQLLQAVSTPRGREFCEHSLANALVGSYVTQAEKEGIAFRTDLDLPKALPIHEYDLGALLGNTLENALEACRRIDTGTPAWVDRFIDLRSSYDGQRLVVRIENSYPGDFLPSGRPTGSSKGPAGGIGLQSVRQVVEAYDGSLDYQGDHRSFVLSAVLRAPAESAETRPH